jgi:hypothetical protein
MVSAGLAPRPDSPKKSSRKLMWGGLLAQCNSLAGKKSPDVTVVDSEWLVARVASAKPYGTGSVHRCKPDTPRPDRNVDNVTFAGIFSRTMSHPSDAIVAQLSMVAEDLQEVVAERGYRIDVALDTDESFGSGQSRAWLMRDLVMDAIAEAASRAGIDFRPVNGSGRELRTIADGVDRRFRCRSASRDSDDQIRVVASSDAPLMVECDEYALFPVEAWVFGWIASSPTHLDEVFVAPILAFVDGSPGHYDLGVPIPLLGPITPPGRGGFKPTSEGLEGFDDENTADDADSA